MIDFLSRVMLTVRLKSQGGHAANLFPPAWVSG